MARKRKASTRVRKSSTRQRGRGIKEVAKKALKFAKDNKLLSRALSLTPYKTAATVASLVGLGRKRRRKTKRSKSLVTIRSLRSMTTAPRRKRSTATGVAVRRPRVVPRRPSRVVLAPVGQIGGGIFSDLGGGLGSIATGIGRGLFGLGRKRAKKGTLSGRGRSAILI